MNKFTCERCKVEDNDGPCTSDCGLLCDACFYDHLKTCQVHFNPQDLELVVKALSLGGS